MVNSCLRQIWFIQIKLTNRLFVVQICFSVHLALTKIYAIKYLNFCHMQLTIVLEAIRTCRNPDGFNNHLSACGWMCDYVHIMKILLFMDLSLRMDWNLVNFFYLFCSPAFPYTCTHTMWDTLTYPCYRRHTQSRWIVSFLISLVIFIATTHSTTNH